MSIGEITLHLGMHKTGTTAIQRTLEHYDDGRVAYADLAVPGDATPNHGVALETIFRSDFENIPHHRRQGRTHSDIRAFRAMFRSRLEGELRRDRERLIISGEAIPRMSRADLEPMCELLAAHSQRITAVVYVRDPLGFCSSMFQQWCRTAVFRPPGSIPLPRYRRKFRKFIKMLGRQHVEFVRYDTNAMPGGSSVNDFAARLGIAEVPGPASGRNVGLSDDATRLLYLLGHHGAFDTENPQHRLALMEIAQLLRHGVGGPPFQLPAGYVGHRVKARDVAWIERTTGFDLAMPEPSPELEDLDATLRTISEPGIEQLRTLVATSGRGPRSQASATEMMLDLFDSVSGRARRKLWSIRATDRAARLRGVLRRG